MRHVQNQSVTVGVDAAVDMAAVVVVALVVGEAATDY
jgi:hypothetical protein